MLDTPSIVRINGVLPDLSTLGDKESQKERLRWNEQVCLQTLHALYLLVVIQLRVIKNTAGEGVAKSLEKMDLSSSPNDDSIISNFFKDPNMNLPDAVLITHSHNDHIKDFPLIAAKYSERKSETLKVYCTKECLEQLNNKFFTWHLKLTAITEYPLLQFGQTNLLT
jgi:ribonuclease BN (tRNA processing enzyme)